MSKTPVFLSAYWQKLVMANYVVDPAILQRYVPHGTELDLWEDRCYISLVGFLFRDTRVLGLRIPGHVNFEEVNLRFYVKYREAGEWKRGVVFIKEIVPRHAITWIANTLYGEHYVTMPMQHRFQDLPDGRLVRYEWKYRRRWNAIQVITEPAPQPLQPGSEAEFITEHYWGYTQLDERRTAEYPVQHPSWNIFPVKTYEIDCNGALLYGPDFSMVGREAPVSVFMAAGSEVTVGRRRVLE